MQQQDYVDRQIQLLATFLKELLSKAVGKDTSFIEKDIMKSLDETIQLLESTSGNPDANDINQLIESSLKLLNHSNPQITMKAEEALLKLKEYVEDNDVPVRMDFLSRW
ncbi:MAG: hypothetical protein KDC76_00645 [Bacteroidetes bacterium]|nr:hypothetical protein [Bacteroidota bacterium]